MEVLITVMSCSFHVPNCKTVQTVPDGEEVGEADRP